MQLKDLVRKKVFWQEEAEMIDIYRSQICCDCDEYNTDGLKKCRSENSLILCAISKLAQELQDKKG